MRLVIVAMLLAVSLAGCTYDEDPASDFERTCPSWFPSPSTPKWLSPQGAMHHNADSTNPDKRDPHDHSKWIPIPGHVGSLERYHDGTLGFVALEFTNVSLWDSLLVFEAYRAADSEPQRTPEGEKPGPTTGPRLAFSSSPTGGMVSSEIRFGPHEGHEDPIIGQGAKVYLNLQPTSSTVDPSRVRIDARYTGNQDDDNTTDSVAVFERVTATFWYLHDDCLA